MTIMDTDGAHLEKRHPIQVVARRTGLTPDVLRVWEKRYEVVQPGRSGGGHRLYSDRDVERLGLLHRATSAGRRISRVADLPLTELREMVHEDDDAAVHVRREAEQGLASDPEVHVRACLTAVETLDARMLETSLMRAAVALSAPMLIEEVLARLVLPGLVTNGQGNALQAKLQAALQQIDRGNATAAINQLAAFVNQLEALGLSGALLQSEVQPLVDLAVQVIIDLSTTP